METDSSQSGLNRIIQLMMRPVIRFCLERSVGVAQFLEQAKIVYLSLAAEELEKRTAKVTVSRLNVMTGIHRRDVTRIYREGKSETPRSTLITRVIGHWEQTSRYQTKSGAPKVLSYEGPKNELDRLVKSVSREVYPGTILQELMRSGAAKKVRGGIKLVRGSNVYTGMVEKGLELVARDTETLLRAAEENVYQPRQQKNLHIRTEYDNIFQSDLPMIREWLYEQGAHFHRNARQFLSQFDKDISPDPKKNGNGKVVLGAFSWTEETEEEEEESQQEKEKRNA